jgi:aldehyde dehydrogenase (NAD+)
MFPEAKLYIDGQWRDASGGKTYDDVNPWTGGVIAQAADASAEDVNAAIAAARRAFDETDWSIDHAKRFALLTRWRDLIEENRSTLVELARQEAGGALGAAASHLVAGALTGFDDLLRFFPEIAWEEHRGTREMYGFGTERIVVREAIGVVAAITPWNGPLYVAIGKVVPALLAGCTVILKAAPDTPLMGAILGKLAAQAGFPAGVFNVITGEDPAMAGNILVEDPRVDVISFTGSNAVGRQIMERGAATLKRVLLELGGKSALIILDDAPDFGMAVMRSLPMFHAGQGCATLTRLLVPRARYEEALAALEKAYAGVAGRWGDPDDPGQVMGPLINKRQLDRVTDYIALGVREGARLLAGGKVRPDKGPGFFVEPTCFVDVDNKMRIAQEEIFGPVLVVIPYEDDSDAVRIANESDYGLGGGVVSADRNRALGIARRIRAGTVSVNGGLSIAPDIPFGGYKKSGIGREWGIEGINEFLEVKLIGIGVAA